MNIPTPLLVRDVPQKYALPRHNHLLRECPQALALSYFCAGVLSSPPRRAAAQPRAAQHDGMAGDVAGCGKL